MLLYNGKSGHVANKDEKMSQEITLLENCIIVLIRKLRQQTKKNLKSLLNCKVR